MLRGENIEDEERDRGRKGANLVESLDLTLPFMFFQSRDLSKHDNKHVIRYQQFGPST